MKRYALALLAVALIFGTCLQMPVSEAEPRAYSWRSIPKTWLNASVRIKVWTNDLRNSYAVGSGSLLPVVPGVPGQLVLTCYHLYGGGRGEENGEVEIRTDKHKGRVWVKATVVAKDAERDWCLLSIDIQTPHALVPDYEPGLDVGDPVCIIGAPSGENSTCASIGYMADFGTDPEGPRELWLSSNAIFYGNSGGPVIDANTGRLIGILVQGRGHTNALAPNIALFVPLVNISKELTKAINGHNEKARAEQVGP